jgi:hypothetical protein
MEFPDDVLTIISEYSKPIMRFSGRYNKCIQELNVARRMIGVKKIVKKRLCDKDADIVIDAFEDYVNALLTTHEARHLLEITPYDRTDTLSWRARNELLGQATLCVEIQHKKTLYMLDVLHKLERNKDYEYEKNLSHKNRFEHRNL